MLSELGTFAGPTDIVLKDRAMLSVIVLWASVALVIAYQSTLFGPGGLEGILGQAS